MNDPDTGLAIEIDVPDDATDEDIVVAVAEVALLADGFHKAMGGGGLEIDAVEIAGPDETPRRPEDLP